MDNKLAINPWLAIWVKPRETIRAIVQFNPSYLLALLYWIYGLPIVLQVTQNRAIGDLYPIGMILGVSAVVAWIVGFIGINVVSALFYWTGQWIGGVGSFKEVRAAVAWSNVPAVVNSAIWVIQLLVFGQRVFTHSFLETPFVGNELLIVFFLSIIQLVIAVWGVVILLKTVGEVQRFSAWKALLNVCLPFIVLLVGFAVLSWLFSVFMTGTMRS